MDDITNRTTALLALLSFQEEEIPSCWVLTSGNVNHLLVLHSSFFFLFPLVVSRCQSEPSKLITPVGSQPKRWEFYRFPPALLYVVCVCIYILGWRTGAKQQERTNESSRFPPSFILSIFVSTTFPSSLRRWSTAKFPFFSRARVRKWTTLVLLLYFT